MRSVECFSQQGQGDGLQTNQAGKYLAFSGRRRSGWERRGGSRGIALPWVTLDTVQRWFVEQGLEAALSRKRQDRPSRARILESEAHLLTLACIPAP